MAHPQQQPQFAVSPNSGASSPQQWSQSGHPVASIQGNGAPQVVQMSGGGLQVAPSAPSAYVPLDVIDDHILRPNAFSVAELVAKVSSQHGQDNGFGCIDFMCCTAFGLFGLCPCMCGRMFRTGIGQIDLWLDSNKRPLALMPNGWQCRPNWLEERLGEYDMSSPKPFQSQGVCLAKIEAGSVYFAHSGGQPVMIAAKEKPGWFVATDAGFRLVQLLRFFFLYLIICGFIG
jgi:hypothetical protein